MLRAWLNAFNEGTSTWFFSFYFCYIIFPDFYVQSDTVNTTDCMTPNKRILYRWPARPRNVFNVKLIQAIWVKNFTVMKNPRLFLCRRLLKPSGLSALRKAQILRDSHCVESGRNGKHEKSIKLFACLLFDRDHKTKIVLGWTLK